MVAAYLIATQKVTRASAIELIKRRRPGIRYATCFVPALHLIRCKRPNDGFLKQLDTFHNAQCIVSVDDKTTRLHYIEKTVRLNQGPYPAHFCLHR